jgi:hypothetical protein
MLPRCTSSRSVVGSRRFCAVVLGLVGGGFRLVDGRSKTKYQTGKP